MKVENNLDTDKVRGLVWRLAFPSMLAQFVNVLYSIVDRMYIGNIEGIGMQYKLCRTELPGSYGDFVLRVLRVLRVRILWRLYICKEG